ncbi:unnamed protein product [Prunus armeniaca]
MGKVVIINFRERGIQEDEGLDAGGNGEEEKRRGGRGRERDGTHGTQWDFKGGAAIGNNF